MTTDEFFGKEFDDAIVAAGNAAREETLRAGVPVFYSDDSGVYIKEMPDGRRFEIQFIPHAPGECNYQVVRELRSAA
jgi:hypothetical protein